jgi:hypothetical protein
MGLTANEARSSPLESNTGIVDPSSSTARCLSTAPGFTKQSLSFVLLSPPHSFYFSPTFSLSCSSMLIRRWFLLDAVLSRPPPLHRAILSHPVRTSRDRPFLQRSRHLHCRDPYHPAGPEQDFGLQGHHCDARCTSRLDSLLAFLLSFELRTYELTFVLWPPGVVV